MKKEDGVKREIILYLKDIAPIAFCFGVFFLLQFLLLHLYDVEEEVSIYLISLEGTFLLVEGIIHLVLYIRKHRKLQKFREEVLLAADEMEAFSNPIEEDLRQILIQFDKEYRALESNYAMERQEMLDYYVLWVHQIKTPITSMRLLLQTEEMQQNKEMSTELFRIEQYVEMVLGYLRMNSMSNDLVLKNCSTDTCIKEVLKKFAKEFIRRKITVEYSPLQWDIVTDEKWLIFVLEQIISNALKYTKEGKISIYRADTGELVIEDTGIGIREEDLPRIFEKGFTGFNGRCDTHSTGIGLYLSKKIITNLSHGISIQSETGVGTRVYLKLDRDEFEMND